MTTTDHGQGTRLIEGALDDAVRGLRRFWRDEAGHTVRVQMADGATLEIHRDDAEGVFGVTTGDGSPLLSLTAPVAIPAALHAMGLTPAQAAAIDGTHRLAATDRCGTTRTELRERTIRVEREGAVLRIDADDDGRPRRVTAPGFDDLVCFWTDGRWQIGRLDGPLLLTIAESQDRTDFAARSGTAEVGWSEAQLDTGQRWSDGGEIPLVDTDLDMAFKVSRRTWHDGRSIGYSRDEHGRLIEWAETLSDAGGPRPTVHARQYTGNELSGTLVNGVRTVVRTDDGGRIRKLIGPMCTVSYTYDANGRRVSRACRGHVTNYTYDPLDQLTCVTTPEGAIEYGWDALGRRISVTADGIEYREHRDTTGRLWSVTTAAGEPVCRFLWWNGRAVARCDADDAIEEIYLTDPLGTLLGVASATTDWCFRDAMQPPFGQVVTGIGWRPTLFGHIADDYTPLICFGGRELDPETGSFLTPDPWHGDPDDPRLLAGHSPASLPKEVPSKGIHAYALSQHDPLGRPDRDGHFAVFNFVLTLMLGPTWGATLTSLSLFLFAPLNFYGEVIGLLGYVRGRVRGRHLWPQHSIFGLRGVTGSSRLGTMGLALNGFVPRGFAGVGGDRCITIGHVAWESRHYFRQLDRPRVLELDDISGTPKPDGKPSLDARRFSSNRDGSILAITGIDRDRRKWVCASWWTRGPGNAVGVRIGGQTFEDRVKAGNPHARGTIFLAQPMPESMPAPRSNSDTETLTVDQYEVAAAQRSDAQFVPEAWFALDVTNDSGIAAGTVLGVSAGPLAAVYGAVLTVLPGAKPVAVLDHDLPKRFTDRPDLRDSVTLQKLTVSAVTSNGWASRVGAAKPQQMIDLVAPSHSVAVSDVFRCAPSAGAPAGRSDAYTAVESVSLAMTVSPTLGGAAVAGATLYRLAPDGTASNAAYPDPPGQPAQLTFARQQPFAVDELVQVSAGAVTRYGRVTAVAEAVAAGPPGPGGAPGTPPTPASITLDEPLTGLAAGAVKVARLKETNRDIDKGANVTQAGDVLTANVATTALFAAKQPVLIDSAPRLVREISAIGTVGVDTVDELIGTGPFTLTKCTPHGSTTSAEMSSSRFVKRTGGAPLAAYGSWPSEIMGLVPEVQAPTPAGDEVGYNLDRQPSGWRFFLQSNPRPADMHPEFGDYWQPVTVAGVDYWLLSTQLKITKTGSNFYWEPDADDHPRRYRQKVTPDPNGAFHLKVQGFVKTAVTRPDAGGGRVFAYPAEAQVPEAPRARWGLGDSLADHELTHTLQNTWWGPILGALPLQGAFRTVRDVLVANNIDVDNDAPEWIMQPFGGGFADMNLFEVASIGGLMQIIWSFVILGPALTDADARSAILSTNFDDWSSVFSPINHAIIDAVPKVQNDVAESKDWKVVLGRALTRALDMKAWTPFVGFIKLMLPDGPRNFLEQQASRKSGNLYSTLLSVDDKFSARLALAPNMTGADVTKQLGGVARLMSYADGPQSRTTALARCDADGSHLQTFNDTFVWGFTADILQFKPAAKALLPADLYQPVNAAAVLTRLTVDGPTIAGRPTTSEFLEVPVNTAMRPLLAAIVPIPPRVWQALGCYLVPASPGVWSATAPDRFPHPADEDAHTAEATITIDSRVSLGSDDVPWQMPPASGVAPTGPKIPRFITEKQTLTVTGQTTVGWQAIGGAGVTVTSRPAGDGWELAVDPPAAGTPLPTDVRVRIWSPVKPTDANLFDLDHPDVPTLAGTRSYLEKDIWIPVRDFLVTVTDLPSLPVGGAAATMTANGSYDLDLPIKVAGPPNIVVAGTLLRASRDSDRPPRGERWKFTAAGDRFIEAPQVVKVIVRFAPGVERPFDIAVNPNFTLDAASFDVTQAAPLELTVNGGTAPFTVVDQPPATSRATAGSAGTKVTVTVAAPPPVPPGQPVPPPIAPITWKLKVRDNAGNLGARTITLRP